MEVVVVFKKQLKIYEPYHLYVVHSAAFALQLSELCFKSLILVLGRCHEEIKRTTYEAKSAFQKRRNTVSNRHLSTATREKVKTCAWLVPL